MVGISEYKVLVLDVTAYITERLSLLVTFNTTAKLSLLFESQPVRDMRPQRLLICRHNTG